jgi:hypothetical protein
MFAKDLGSFQAGEQAPKGNCRCSIRVRCKTRRGLSEGSIERGNACSVR